MSDQSPISAQAVADAIRMASEAAEDDRVFSFLVREILSVAPEMDGDSRVWVRLLLDAMQNVGASLVVAP